MPRLPLLHASNEFSDQNKFAMTKPTSFLDVGFHDNVPAAVYHADPCPAPSLSSSMAAMIVDQSPAHARLKHPRLCPPAEETPAEETPAMSFGSVVHELLLGTGGGFAVFDGETWRGNEAKAFRAQAAVDGKTPIKRADYSRAQKCVDAVFAQLQTMGLAYVLTQGKSEQVAIWKQNGQYCRAMFDKRHPERNEIWDIKTTGVSAHPDKIKRIVTNLHYDLRSEFYLMGAAALTGVPARAGGLGYQFLFVETEPPFCVTPCFLDESLKLRGRQLAMQAVETFARCMETGFWPGYVDHAVEIAAPGWVDYELADEITAS